MELQINNCVLCNDNSLETILHLFLCFPFANYVGSLHFFDSLSEYDNVHSLKGKIERPELTFHAPHFIQV